MGMRLAPVCLASRSQETLRWTGSLSNTAGQGHLGKMKRVAYHQSMYDQILNDESHEDIEQESLPEPVIEDLEAEWSVLGCDCDCDWY